MALIYDERVRRTMAKEGRMRRGLNKAYRGTRVPGRLKGIEGVKTRVSCGALKHSFPTDVGNALFGVFPIFW